MTAGLAEIAAGAIAMGLGGFLAARTDQEHFQSEHARENWEIDNLHEKELRETEEIFAAYGLAGNELKSVVSAISSNRVRWVDFMMRFELGLEKPDPRRAPISALTIAISYLIGGFIPLGPYIFIRDLTVALYYSVVMTGIALTVFGAVKGRLTGISMLKSASQTLFVGGVAAGAAFYLASLFG